MARLRIATRSSRLARWQADRVAALIAQRTSVDNATVDVEIEMVFVSTAGDQRRDVPIHELGGTGVFVKEVQQAVIDGVADIAVHSAKDLPSVTALGLTLACVPERADVRDVLVGMPLRDIPHGGTIATGSVRRRAQLRAVRPDLIFCELRGNIDTRLDNAHRFDAIVLAAAGIDRIERSAEIVERLEIDVMVPQIGQGALAIECRAGDHDVIELLSHIDDDAQHKCLDTERAFLASIGGGCDAPVGAYARQHEATIELVALLAAPDGSLHRDHRKGPVRDATALGAAAARFLLPHLASTP